MGSFLAFMGVVPTCGPRDFGMIWECPKIGGTVCRGTYNKDPTI